MMRIFFAQDAQWIRADLHLRSVPMRVRGLMYRIVARLQEQAA